MLGRLHITALAVALCGLPLATDAQGHPPGPPGPTAVSSLPNGRVGQAYPPTPIVRGGSPPYRVSSTPALPAGLAVSPSGEITGAPRASGDFRFVLEITDAGAPPRTVHAAFHLRVLESNTRP